MPISIWKLDVYLGVEVFQIAFNNLNALWENYREILKTPSSIFSCPSSVPFVHAAFKFWISAKGGNAERVLSWPSSLVAYYIIQICSEKNTGLNFKGDEEVGEQFRPRPCLHHF